MHAQPLMHKQNDIGRRTTTHITGTALNVYTCNTRRPYARPREAGCGELSTVTEVKQQTRIHTHRSLAREAKRNMQYCAVMRHACNHGQDRMTHLCTGRMPISAEACEVQQKMLE